MPRRRRRYRRRHYRGPRPYASIGIFGPRVGCRFWLIAVAAAVAAVIAAAAGMLA